MNSCLPRGSIIGLPPNTANELEKNGVDISNYMDKRGSAMLDSLHERDAFFSEVDAVNMELVGRKGCLEYVLELPGLRTVREWIPQEIKDKIKSFIKDRILGDYFEP